MLRMCILKLQCYIKKIHYIKSLYTWQSYYVRIYMYVIYDVLMWNIISCIA